MSAIIDTENIIEDITAKIDGYVKSELKDLDTGKLELDVSGLKGFLDTIKDELALIQDFNNHLVKELQEKNQELLGKVDVLTKKIETQETKLNGITAAQALAQVAAHNAKYGNSTTAANSDDGSATDANNDKNNKLAELSATGKKRTRQGKVLKKDSLGSGSDKGKSTVDSGEDTVAAAVAAVAAASKSGNVDKDLSATWKAVSNAEKNGTLTGDGDGTTTAFNTSGSSSENKGKKGTDITTSTTVTAVSNANGNDENGVDSGEDKPETLIKRRKKWTQEKLTEIEKFDLQIKETPENVKELYTEFEETVKKQIADFEKQFGKGKLSKISKIRTYQRRAALVREIQNYSESHSCTLDESIAFFDGIVTNNRKSVAWLYNNLAKVLNDYNI